MNIQTKSVLVAAVAAVAVTPLLAKSGGKHGTNVFHYNARAVMTNDGVEPGATGTVAVMQATQGNADKETVTVSAKGLTPSTDYSLFAATRGSSTETNVDGFTTDGKGRATLKFGTGKKSLDVTPLVPVSNIGQFDIVNSNDQAVLTADLSNPSQLQYLVKQDISTNDGVSLNTSALLQIKSALNKGVMKTKFTLNASGLDTNTDYLLNFNGSTVQTNTSDAKGKLKITSAPTPDDILDLQSVNVTDTSGTPVTGTATLP